MDIGRPQRIIVVEPQEAPPEPPQRENVPSHEESAPVPVEPDLVPAAVGPAWVR